MHLLLCYMRLNAMLPGMLGLTGMRCTGSPHSSAAATVPVCVVKPRLNTCAALTPGLNVCFKQLHTELWHSMDDSANALHHVM